MDELYYEDGQVPDLASSGFTFSDEVIAKALVGIYKGEVDIDKGVEQNLYKETLRILNKATAKGIADAIDGGAPAPKKDFLWQLRHSNEVFSAFKTHTQQNHLADLLTDSKGKLKPFGQFAKDSEAVIGKYNRQWLRTEYDTAVIRAHQAANWQKFEEEKDVLPNLEWIPSTSPNPSEDHMVFWGTILPVDDGFWDAHRPGDRWNCKCDLRSTDKAVTHAPDADIISKHDEPAKGLDNNPGKDGKIFNQSHPYFPKSCAACPFSSPKRLMDLAGRERDCYNCPFIDGCIDRPNAKREIDTAAFLKKREVKQKDLMPVNEKKKNKKYKNLHIGIIHLSGKARERLLKHAHHDYDVDAAVYVWNHPNKLKYLRLSPLGEGKDMSLPKNKDNIKNKRKRGVTGYVVYRTEYNGRTYIVKTEISKYGFEQPYIAIEE